MSLMPTFFEQARGKRVLILEPFFNTPHVETGLEVAERLVAHNEVIYAGPDVLRSVTDESYRFRTRVIGRATRKRFVSRYLHPSVRRLSGEELERCAPAWRAEDVRRIFDPRSPEALQAQYEAFDLGMGIRSSLLSLTRDTGFALSDFGDFAFSLASSSLRLYQLTERLCGQLEPDAVIFFNGRFAPVRAIRRACEATGTPFIVHERGSSRDQFALYRDATPHQPPSYRAWVDTWWEGSLDPERRAWEFLERRRQGQATSWFSFTRRQVAGECPARSGRRRVTFFTSSEDELAAIGDELPPDTPLCDQAVAIRAFGDACRARGDEYVVRFHPNTPASSVRLFEVAQREADVVSMPDDSVDTYALIDSSDVVVTHNSTVGLEAAAVGKPVYYCGRNVFEACRSVRRLRDEAEVGAALDEPGASEPLDALKFLFFFGHHGIRYTLYQPGGLVTGTWKGRELNAPFSLLRNLKLRVTRGGV